MRMKIETDGFRVTEICEQIPNILVSAAGVVRIAFRTNAGGLATSGEMSRVDFDALYEAMTAVRDRLDSEALAHQVERKVDERPLVIVDSASDVWVWRDDHNAYVIATHGHESCEKGGTLDDGSTLEYIENEWGPLTFPLS